MASISGSVGRGGLNRLPDVKTVQALLNKSPGPGASLLVVDGVVGPKSIAAINEFQRRVVQCVPDGRVDANGRSMKALNQFDTGVSAPGVPTVPGAPGTPGTATPLPASFVTYQKDLEAIVRAGNAQWWNDFQAACADTVGGWGVLFNGVTTLQEAQKLGQLYVQARRWGIPMVAFLDWLKPMYSHKKTIEPAAREAIELLLKLPEASKLAAVLKAVGTAGKFVSFMKFLVEYIGYWKQGDYHMAFVEIYKTAMGDRIPLAAVADAIESALASSQLGRGDPKKNGLFFKVLRIINLIGLGALAVDTAGVVVCCAVDGEMDESRFRRLMERMRASPGQIFVEMGDDLATALIKIADMPDGAVREMFSLSSMKEMFDYALSSD